MLILYITCFHKKNFFMKKKKNFNIRITKIFKLYNKNKNKSKNKKHQLYIYNKY